MAGIFFIGLLMVQGGIRNSGQGSNLILKIGIAVVSIYLVLFFILWIKNGVKTEHKIIKEKERIKSIKENWLKLEVDLTKAEIKNNNWRQEIIVNEGKKTEYIKYEQMHMNYVEFELAGEHTKIKYPTYISKELKTLEMHFALKERTFFYIDPEDSDNNYLDLEFLEKKANFKLFTLNC